MCLIPEAADGEPVQTSVPCLFPCFVYDTFIRVSASIGEMICAKLNQNKHSIWERLFMRISTLSSTLYHKQIDTNISLVRFEVRLRLLGYKPPYPLPESLSGSDVDRTLRLIQRLCLRLTFAIVCFTVRHYDGWSGIPISKVLRVTSESCVYS